MSDIIKRINVHAVIYPTVVRWRSIEILPYEYPVIFSVNNYCNSKISLVCEILTGEFSQLVYQVFVHAFSASVNIARIPGSS